MSLRNYVRLKDNRAADFIQAENIDKAREFVDGFAAWAGSTVVVRPSDQAVYLGQEYDPDTREFLEPEIAEVPPPTLEEVKAEKQQELIDWASAKQAEAISGYSEAERKTWADQEAQSQAYLASSDPADAPLLAQQVATSNALGTAMTMEDLANDIISAAENLRGLSSVVRGIRLSKYRQIEGAGSVADLEQFSTELYDQTLAGILQAAA